MISRQAQPRGRADRVAERGERERTHVVDTGEGAPGLAVVGQVQALLEDGHARRPDRVQRDGRGDLMLEAQSRQLGRGHGPCRMCLGRRASTGLTARPYRPPRRASRRRTAPGSSRAGARRSRPPPAGAEARRQDVGLGGYPMAVLAAALRETGGDQALGGVAGRCPSLVQPDSMMYYSTGRGTRYLIGRRSATRARTSDDDTAERGQVEDGDLCRRPTGRRRRRSPRRVTRRAAPPRCAQREQRPGLVPGLELEQRI